MTRVLKKYQFVQAGYKYFLYITPRVVDNPNNKYNFSTSLTSYERIIVRKRHKGATECIETFFMRERF